MAKEFTSSLKAVLADATRRGYGIPMVNTYNLEWTKAIIFTAQELEAPVLVGVNQEAADYMGGFAVVVALVRSLLKENDVTVPVFVHLDHGTEQSCEQALVAGFDSVMFDGSALPFEQNLSICKRLLAQAKNQGACFEAEIGKIGGKEDSVKSNVSMADASECAAMSAIGVDMLAVGIGNVHGKYPPDWPGLELGLLAEIAAKTKDTPLVLHGSSWVPADQVKKAISLRVCKINVSSELKEAFAKATVEYVNAGKAVGKGLDPRKLLGPGYEAIRQVLRDKFNLFNAAGKA